jgi:xylose isomerase
VRRTARFWRSARYDDAVPSTSFEPAPEDRFTVGLWCTAYRGREVFGGEVRPPLHPLDNLRGLAEAGCWGFNFHDDDVVSPTASADEVSATLAEMRGVMDETGIRNSMATCNLFELPCFRDGAWTSRDARVRAYARQKSMRAVDMGAELGARIFVMWGGREGLEVQAARDQVESIKRYREGIEFVARYIKDQGLGMRIAIEPKPNEPRGDIFLPTAGHVLAMIATLDESVRDIVGVNPEIQHARMAGLDTVHELALCLDAGKLFHVDLGAQKPTRYDQDLRFGSEDYKETFFVVKLMEERAPEIPRAFDVKPYRADTTEEVWDLVRGCIRSYLVLRDKVRRWNEDDEIQALVAQVALDDAELEGTVAYSPDAATALRERIFDPEELANRRLGYQRLDQLTFDLLTGVR